MNYNEKKAAVREEAIQWQYEAAEKDYSYEELVEFQEHFEKLAKRYGLLGEFRENSIL